MSKIKIVILVIIAIIVVFAIVQVVNAAKYKMLVNVKEGENIIGVNPTAEALDFGDLSRNNGMTRYVELKSGGGTSVYVAAFNIGGISDLVKLDRNFFVLKPGETVKLAYEIQIPPSAEVKKYSGYTVIFRLPKLW